MNECYEKEPPDQKISTPEGKREREGKRGKETQRQWEGEIERERQTDSKSIQPKEINEGAAIEHTE